MEWQAAAWGVALLVTGILTGLWARRKPPADMFPEIGRICRMKLKPGDTIFIEHYGHMSSESVAAIKTGLHGVWPEHRIVVLEDGMKISLVEATHAGSTEQEFVEAVVPEQDSP